MQHRYLIFLAKINFDTNELHSLQHHSILYVPILSQNRKLKHAYTTHKMALHVFQFFIFLAKFKFGKRVLVRNVKMKNVHLYRFSYFLRIRTLGNANTIAKTISTQTNCTNDSNRRCIPFDMFRFSRRIENCKTHARRIK